MPSAKRAMSWRRPASARHSPAAHAALSTQRDSERGRPNGANPRGQPYWAPVLQSPRAGPWTAWTDRRWPQALR
eukprot:11205852-Lingulodinium_polyedra.AAC.1